METVTQVAQAMQYGLGEVADDLGRASGFIQRERVLKGSSFVQTLVFAWLAQPAASMEELSQSAANLGVGISRQGLDERFTPLAAEFLKGVLSAAIEQVITAEAVTTPVLARFNGVYVLDSTSIRLPACLAQVWAGNQQAALKVSVSWDLRGGGLSQVHLQAGRQHDQRAPMQQQPLPAGALRVADLGYYNLAVFERLDQAGAYWVSRYKVGTEVYTQQGQVLNVLKYLQEHSLEGESLDIPIRLGQRKRLACRLVAVPVSQATQEQRQARLKRQAARKQRRLSEAVRDLAGWNIYLTNAPVELLSATEVGLIGRVRWQIEQLFDVWKSDGLLDEWRTANPWRVLCEVYAKLLALLIQHWLFLVGDGHDLRSSLTQAARTIRKKAWHIAMVLGDQAGLCQVLMSIRFCLKKGCRISSSRHKPPSFSLFYGLS